MDKENFWKYCKIVEQIETGEIILHQKNLQTLIDSWSHLKNGEIPITTVAFIGPNSCGKSFFSNLLIEYIRMHGSLSWTKRIKREGLQGFSYGVKPNVVTNGQLIPEKNINAIYLYPELITLKTDQREELICILHVHQDKRKKGNENIWMALDALLVMMSSILVNIVWNDKNTLSEINQMVTDPKYSPIKDHLTANVIHLFRGEGDVTREKENAVQLGESHSLHDDTGVSVHQTQSTYVTLSNFLERFSEKIKIINLCFGFVTQSPSPALKSANITAPKRETKTIDEYTQENKKVSIRQNENEEVVQMPKEVEIQIKRFFSSHFLEQAKPEIDHWMNNVLLKKNFVPIHDGFDSFIQYFNDNNISRILREAKNEFQENQKLINKEILECMQNFDIIMNTLFKDKPHFSGNALQKALNETLTLVTSDLKFSESKVRIMKASRKMFMFYYEQNSLYENFSRSDQEPFLFEKGTNLPDVFGRSKKVKTNSGKPTFKNLASIDMGELSSTPKRQLAIQEAKQLVEKFAQEFGSVLHSNLHNLDSLEQLRDFHQSIRENIIQKFLKTTTTKNRDLIADSILKLEFQLDEMSEEMEDLFNKKKSEVNALFGAIMEVKKFYQESMDRQFSNNESGFFNEMELARMDRQTHQAALNSFTTNTPLPIVQIVKLKEQLKLFQKYKEWNALTQHSYKNTKDVAIGIDLGTTYCGVAVYHMGQVKIIRNYLGENTTPSYVTINADGTTVVGTLAKELSFMNPDSTVFDAKRILGRRLDDEKLKEGIKFWPFIVEEKDGKAQIKVHGKYYRPEYISGVILEHLKREAEDIMGLKISKAVITVPAYFTDGQRQATVDAGEMAGLKILGILNEPTAAAMAYRLQWYTHGIPRKALIYDLGERSFDVAVLEIREDKIDLLSISRDSHLGGEDFDRAMVDHCVKEFKKDTGIDLFEGKMSRDRVKVDEPKRRLKRLQLRCVEAKNQLSNARFATIDIVEIVRGKNLNVKIRRENFEEMNDVLFRKTIKIVDEALQSAKVGRDEIDDLIFVGGSTKIWKLQETVEAYFPNIALRTKINPDEVLAYGAAVQAAILNFSPTANFSYIV